MIPTLGAAFLLGLTASGHCVLMCGPIVAAVQPRDWRGAALMHGTRISVYAAIGAATGAAGAAISGLGAGRWLAWLVAATLLAQAVISWRGTTGTSPVGRAAGRLVSSLGQRVQARGIWAPVTWGLINGLLPCGMVYGAATLAVGLASPVSGAAAMAAFGLGTVPVLMLVARPASALLRTLVARRPWLAPAVLVILALIIGMRGMPSPGSATSADPHAAHMHHAQASNPQR
jgi:sulfite exporter TauE/SafE